jgi:hypothetical protein
MDRRSVIKHAGIAGVLAAGAAPAQPDTSVAQAPQPSPDQTPVAKGNDLSRDTSPADFQPLGWSPVFVTVGVSLAAIWALGLVVLLARNYASSPLAAKSRLLKDRRNTLKKLEDSSITDPDFLAGATSFLAEVQPDHSLPGAGLTSTQTEILDRLLAKHQESRYSTRKVAPITREDKASYLKTLHEILSSKN